MLVKEVHEDLDIDYRIYLHLSNVCLLYTLTRFRLCMYAFYFLK